MAQTKITITIDKLLVASVDRLVVAGDFPIAAAPSSKRSLKSSNGSDASDWLARARSSTARLSGASPKRASAPIWRSGLQY